jgi:hypothetical protein
MMEEFRFRIFVPCEIASGITAAIAFTVHMIPITIPILIKIRNKAEILGRYLLY